jgi:DNA transformation protein and related proteins
MAVSSQYLEFVLDQLGSVRAVRSRRMFSGVGFYAGELFFAIASDDTLFFKVNDETRAHYEREGMKPFCPFEDDTKAMRGYYELPSRALEDSEELALWMARAIAVAAASQAAKPRRRTASRPRKSAPLQKRPRT